MENNSVNDYVIINLEGRIDSENCDQVEDEILTKVYNSKAKTIVLNMKKLNYISSAGLRVILRLKKTYGDVSVINVNPDVYQVFEMTGYTDILPVKKA
ncbi:MAG: STAS domain-containing protein [Clostridia bacterium]|nr:STAS domain-containing protein [Clostridia bacterium]